MLTVSALLKICAVSGVALGLLLATSTGARAEIDLTGDWNIELVGILTQTFSATVTQNGSDLEIDLGVGDAQLAGTIDPATGEFGVFGCPGDCMGLSMNGTASPDGNSMSGTFFSPVTFDGSFTGTKKNPTPQPVGGIAELPDVAGTPLETGGSSGRSANVVAGIAVAAAAGALALGGAAWYARRRRGG